MAEVVITIRGKDLTTDAAKSAAAKVLGLGDAVSDAKKKTDAGNQSFKSFVSNSLGPIPGAAGLATAAMGALGAAFSVRAIINWAQDTIAFAGNLQDMAQGANLSTDELQELGFAGKRVGLEMGALTGIVGQLVKRVATGDESAVSALQSLGLDIDHLRQQKPADLFTEVVEAVGRISDPLAQAGVASQLFGRNFEGVLRLGAEGLRDLRQEAHETNNVLDQQAIATLDEFGDALGDIGTQLKVLSAQALAPMIRQLADFLALTDEVSKRRFIDPQQQKEFEEHGVAIATNTEGLAAYNRGLIINEESIKRLGEAHQDGISRAQLIENRLKALKDQALAPLSVEQRRHIAELEQWGVSQKEIAELTGTNILAVKREIEAKKDATKATEKERQEAEKLTKALQDLLNQRIRDVEGTDIHRLKTLSLADALESVGTTLDMDAEPAMQRWRATLNQVSGDVAEVERHAHVLNFGFQGLTDGLEDLGVKADPAMEPLIRNLKEARDPLDGLLAVLEDIQTEFAQMAVVGIRAFQNIRGTLKNTDLTSGGKFADVATIGLGAAASMVDPDTKAGGVLSGAASGAAIGTAILPGIGTAVGAGIGALVGAFKKGEGEKVNDMRDEFAATFGDLHDMNVAFAEVGLTLDRVLDADKVDEFNAAVKEFETRVKAVGEAFGALEQEATNTFGVITPAMQPFLDQLLEGNALTAQQRQLLADLKSGAAVDFAGLTQMASEYGITLEGLGPKFQQANIDDTAQQYLRDFELLTAAGGDINGVMVGMQDEVQTLLDQAFEFGGAIPEALRPMLQHFIDGGLLVDAQGNKLKDLSGISFSDTPIEDTFEKLTSTLEDLIEALGGVPGKLRDISNTEVRNPFDGWSAPDWWSGDFPGGPQGPGALPGHAAGGLFRHEHIARIAEAGRPEIVGDVDFMTRALGGALERFGGGHASAEAVRAELAAMRRDFPSQIARATVVALVKAGAA